MFSSILISLIIAIQNAPTANIQDAAMPSLKKAGASESQLTELFGAKLDKMDGATVNTKEALKDRKQIVLYFSASWCPPCRKFTPDLVSYAKANKDSKDVIVILVGSDQTAAKQADYMKKYDMDFYAIPFDKARLGKIKRLYGGGGIPNLVILQPDGKVVKGSYETNGKYSPSNRKSYIGPKPVLDALKKMASNDSKKTTKS